MTELAFPTVCFYAQSIGKLWEGILSPGWLADTADFPESSETRRTFPGILGGMAVRDYVGPGRVS